MVIQQIHGLENDHSWFSDNHAPLSLILQRWKTAHILRSYRCSSKRIQANPRRDWYPYSQWATEVCQPGGLSKNLSEKSRSDWLFPKFFLYHSKRIWCLKEILEGIDMRYLMKFLEFQEFLEDGQFNKEKRKKRRYCWTTFPWRNHRGWMSFVPGLRLIYWNMS